MLSLTRMIINLIHFLLNMIVDLKIYLKKLSTTNILNKILFLIQTDFLNDSSNTMFEWTSNIPFESSGTVGVLGERMHSATNAPTS